MVQFQLVDTEPNIPTIQPAPMARPTDDWLTQYRDEINAYYTVLKGLNDMDHGEIFQALSAFSARVSEMRTRCYRVDSPRAQSFRTREIEPLLEEIDRQFRIHSRIVALREQEWKIQTGRQ